jgi:hypothetical protein
MPENDPSLLEADWSSPWGSMSSQDLGPWDSVSWEDMGPLCPLIARERLESATNLKPSSLSQKQQLLIFSEMRTCKHLFASRRIQQEQAGAACKTSLTRQRMHVFFKNSHPPALEIFSQGKDKAECSEWVSNMRSAISSSNPAAPPL